jgi:hypothetical protein
MESPTTFGHDHFGTADLGDCRRTARLVELANRCLAHPHGSLPAKLHDPKDLQALYRLVRQPKVTHAAVFQPHRDRTRQRWRTHPDTLLCLFDITELDFTSKTSLKSQLGPIGDGRGRGYECFHGLVYDPTTDTPVGLAYQHLHRRVPAPPQESVAAKRSRESRESRLWVQAAQALGPPPAVGRRVVVCDRAADTYEFLQQTATAKQTVVVRSTHNRRCTLGHGPDGVVTKVHDAARTFPPVLGKRVTVAATATQPARTATVTTAFGAVRLLAPHVRRGNHTREPVPVWVVHVVEVAAPATVANPVEWFLLTHHPVEDAAAALTVQEWYECRPVVEEYHKCQKTGCAIEAPQFTATARLEPVIALLSVVAVQLLALRSLARQPMAATQPAREVVPGVWVEVLSRWRMGAAVDLTVRAFVLALGRLGGHQNRQGDGLPGWQTLWKGWGELMPRVAGVLDERAAVAARAATATPEPNTS